MLDRYERLPDPSISSLSIAIIRAALGNAD